MATQTVKTYVNPAMEDIGKASRLFAGAVGAILEEHLDKPNSNRSFGVGLNADSDGLNLPSPGSREERLERIRTGLVELHAKAKRHAHSGIVPVNFLRSLAEWLGKSTLAKQRA